MNSTPTLGIDFGTTNSVVAAQIGGETEVLLNSEGNRLTPSVVYYPKEQEQKRPIVGQLAENKAEMNPDRVIRSIKRNMGDTEKIYIDGDSYKVEEIASEVLWKLRSDASEALDVPRDDLTRVVITRPAYWEEDRTVAIREAARMAGFKSVRLIKEPASAAIAYGGAQPGSEETIGVYDLGGGTFDFAVVDVETPGPNDIGGEEYSVEAQAGDPQLGGDDWDQRILEWAVDSFVQEYGADPTVEHPDDKGSIDHKVRTERMREEARRVKETLSNPQIQEEDFRLPFLMAVNGEEKSIEETLTQQEFDKLTSDLVERTIPPIEQALTDANVRTNDLDRIVLVGGSTHMQQVQKTIKEKFNITPQSHVNPDEAVARGASKHAGRDDILLLEVTPLSLGIGIKGDKFKRIIPRNTRLPASASEIFTTSERNQRAVRIPIYQGEREIGSQNRNLKTLVIEDMVPGSTGSAQIEVEFQVQKNGIINVTATENTTDKTVSANIEGENDLSDDEIEKHIQEAKDNEEHDRKRRIVNDALAEAEHVIDSAESLIGGEGLNVTIPDHAETHLKQEAEKLKDLKDSDDTTVAQLREATSELESTIVELGDDLRDRQISEGADSAEDVVLKNTDAVEKRDGPQTKTGTDASTPKKERGVDVEGYTGKHGDEESRPEKENTTGEESSDGSDKDQKEDEELKTPDQGYTVVDDLPSPKDGEVTSPEDSTEGGTDSEGGGFDGPTEETDEETGETNDTTDTTVETDTTEDGDVEGDEDDEEPQPSQERVKSINDEMDSDHVPQTTEKSLQESYEDSGDDESSTRESGQDQFGQVDPSDEDQEEDSGIIDDVEDSDTQETENTEDKDLAEAVSDSIDDDDPQDTDLDTEVADVEAPPSVEEQNEEETDQEESPPTGDDNTGTTEESPSEETDTEGQQEPDEDDTTTPTTEEDNDNEGDDEDDDSDDDGESGYVNITNF